MTPLPSTASPSVFHIYLPPCATYVELIIPFYAAMPTPTYPLYSPFSCENPVGDKAFSCGFMSNLKTMLCFPVKLTLYSPTYT